MDPAKGLPGASDSVSESSASSCVESQAIHATGFPQLQNLLY